MLYVKKIDENDKSTNYSKYQIAGFISEVLFLEILRGITSSQIS